MRTNSKIRKCSVMKATQMIRIKGEDMEDSHEDQL